MPFYEYFCDHCKTQKDMYQPITKCDDVVTCDNCQKKMKKLISAGFFIGEKVESPYYSTAAGKVVKNTAELRQIAKDKNWVEVGNEKMKHNPIVKEYSV